MTTLTTHQVPWSIRAAARGRWPLVRCTSADLPHPTDPQTLDARLQTL